MAGQKLVFIDTSIFDGQRYDFSSTAFRAFVDAAASDYILVVPLPTANEVERHIVERSAAAAAALRRAREEYAFLRHVAAVPQTNAEKRQLLETLKAKSEAEWQQFKAKFRVVELDCSTVNPTMILGWYHKIEPPFGDGEKRREFADAFSIAAVLEYAEKVRAEVAVISSDNDFKKACGRSRRLRYFPSLDAFTTEVLQEQERVYALATSMARGSIAQIVEKVKTEFPDRAFEHAEDPSDSGSVENVTAAAVELDPEDVTVIEITSHGCTVSFRGTVNFTADVEYDDPTSYVSGDREDPPWYLHRCAGTVEDTVEIEGTAELHADEDWTIPGEVHDIQLRPDFIWVTTEAPQKDDREDYDFEEDPRPNERPLQ